MSVQAMGWVIEHSKFTGCNFVVLLMIANHARSDGTGAWPSIGTLARESRVSERTVHRAIKELEISGELKVTYKQGPNGTNYYDIAQMSQCQIVTVPNATETLPTTTLDPAIAMAPEPSLTILLEPSEESVGLKFPKPQKRIKAKAVSQRSVIYRERAPRERKPEAPRLSLGEQNRLAALRAVQQISKP